MDISIGQPYFFSKRDLSFDNTTITLNPAEVNGLFEVLDNELHHKETREDLINKINDLKEEIAYLELLIKNYENLDI